MLLDFSGRTRTGISKLISRCANVRGYNDFNCKIVKFTEKLKTFSSLFSIGLCLDVSFWMIQLLSVRTLSVQFDNFQLYGIRFPSNISYLRTPRDVTRSTYTILKIVGVVVVVEPSLLPGS